MPEKQSLLNIWESQMPNKTVWFDFSNPPHVNLFKPLLAHFSENEYHTFSTAREFVETIGLLKKYNIAFNTYGKHGGGNRLKKAYNLINRNLLLLRKIPDFDLSVSSSFEAPQVAWLKGRKSVVFDDNEIAPNWLYAKFATKVFYPSVIPKEGWNKVGIKDYKLQPYNGFKEDIYIADYTPDSTFLDQLPFANYVVVRPENILAAYVPKGRKSIVPQLVESLINQGMNVLYLPRYDFDRDYISNHPNIFIPEKPLNGLDVCYYADAVLTGAGTFAREAACLGVPSVSFFAGDDLLTVDKSMIQEKKMFFSRDTDEIIKHLLTTSKKQPDFKRSKAVKKEVIEKLTELLKS